MNASDIDEVQRPHTFGKTSIIGEQAVPNCPVCGGTKRRHVTRSYDYELETCGNSWDFWRCDDCSTRWLDPRPATKELPVIYPSHYYAYAMTEKLSKFVLWGKDQLDRAKMNGLGRWMSSSPKSYLDVGCGDGRYLRLMAKLSIPKSAIFGIELSSPAIATLRQQGFTVIDKRVEDCTEIAPSSLDLITMFHVIEHVENPVAVLKHLGEWLTPNGLLAFETPNTDALDARTFRRTWWGGYHVPRHWTLFDEASARRALDAAGLEFVGIKYQTGHSFWLYSFHHVLKYKLEIPWLAARFDPLKSRIALVGATAFDILRGMLGSKTSAMLVLARRKA
jgi:2-polyprenyl-3-methyl-5-hydroxy-6-metoxy-1,4-benzoquinol methylase